MIRKWLCLLLTFLLVFPAVAGPAENTAAEAEVLEYLYSFTPGTMLEGEGMEKIKELLEAIQIRFTRQKTGTDDTIRLQLISEGDEAFSLTAGETAGEEFALVCSLLGDNKLTLRREQLSSFMLTLVQALGEQGFLKGDNLIKMSALADRAGKVLGDYLDRAPEEAPDTGIDITPYLKKITEKATATEQREIPPEERDETGAVTVTSYMLSEEQRKEFVDRSMDKIVKLPIIGDQLNNGSLRIGGQEITEKFIRSAFGDTPGEVTLDIWQDADGQLVRFLLHIPDVSGFVTDPQFARMQGVELSIKRTKGEGKELTSVTTIHLPGLEGDLLTMTMLRTPGKAIPPMTGAKVHPVGDMNSEKLAELLRSMGWTIIANAANMVITLPYCVAEILIRKILK